MTFRHLVLFGPALAAVLFLSACTGPAAATRQAASDTADAVKPHELINAVAWMQKAAEYEAVTTQAYNVATRLLPVALADSSWTALPDQRNFSELPPAVIVDVDETVLDNSPFEARMIREDAVFERSRWNAWVMEEAAVPVPGALAFLKSAAAAGVTVFYVTNRSHELDDATTRNLTKAGFPMATGQDAVLTRGERPEWTRDKSLRREFVAEDYRIIFLAGDDLNDFVAADDASEQERVELVRRHASYWGERWVLIPNPAYGSWERVITRSAGASSREEQLRAKREALRVR